jgi:hypothetical protein
MGRYTFLNFFWLGSGNVSSKGMYRFIVCLGFEGLTAVVMKVSILWAIIAYGP